MTTDDLNIDAGATRKLSAVMFTDIRGFSRKMAENEAGAFDLLKKHDALLRVLTTKFGGKVIKSIGDSFMVDFPSAVNAVKCAIEAQKRFTVHNAGKSEFDTIEIRVGIHLGDVLIRGGDIFGDGVNIASRIESITAPTRICISHDVYSQIRNKMAVQVFRIGPMSLKNIPEPVEVYELLIDEIAAFAVPSAMAQEQARSKSFDNGARRESEEAAEARRVEEAKQRAAAQSVMTDEQKQKLIAEIYTRAEKFYQVGHITEAEAELRKIEEIDPSYTPSDSQRKDEEEREAKAQVHLQKARELMAQKNLDAAEKEVNRVFEYFPLHVGAQQILMRIEEERYQVEQEARSRKVQEKKERVQKEESEDRKKFDERIARARQQMEDRQYTEAIYTMREAFLIEPNNSAARQLEEEIKLRQLSKAEEDKQLAEEETRRAAEERQVSLQKRAEELKASRPVQVEERKKPFPTALVVRLVVALIVIGAGIGFGPSAYRTAFPKTISVAVLPFTSSDAGLAADPLLSGLASVVSDDLARLAHAHVVGFGTSSRGTAPPGAAAEKAARLGVSSLLTGTLEPADDGFDASVRLVDAQSEQVVVAKKFRFTLASIDQFRRQVVQAVIAGADLDDSAAIASTPSGDVDIRSAYLRAIALLDAESPVVLGQARDVTQQALASASAPPVLRALWSEAIARLVRAGAVTEDSLAVAITEVLDAVKADGNRPEVLRACGTVLLTSRRFGSVAAPIRRGLALFQHQPESHRLLAELAIISGRRAEADAELASADAIDPGHPRTLFLHGLSEHLLKGNEQSAVAWYEKAIAAGGNEHLITRSFMTSAWLRGTKPDALIQFSTDELARDPSDYHNQYLLGRAYAEQVDSSQVHFTTGLHLTEMTLEITPRNVDALVFKALFLTRLGKFQDALSIVDRVMAGDPDPRTLYRISNIYALQKKKPEVLRIMKIALDRRFDLAEVLNPDFGSLLDDPEYLALVARPLSPAQQ